MKQIIQRPLLTEKTMAAGEYAFAVDVSANKDEIRKVIDKLFGVKIISIKTTICKGVVKNGAGKRKQTKSSDWKKAVIKLDKDQKIELFDVGQGKENK